MANSIAIPHVFIVKDEYFKGGSVGVSDNAFIMVSDDASSVYLSWFGDKIEGVCRLISKETDEKIWENFDKVISWLNHGEERALRYGDCSGTWYLDFSEKVDSEFIALKNVKKSTCTYMNENGRNPIEVFFKIQTEPVNNPSEERVAYINNILERAHTFDDYERIQLSALNAANTIGFFSDIQDSPNKKSVVDIEIQKPNVLKIENSHVTIISHGLPDKEIKDNVKTKINIAKLKEFVKNTNSKTLQFIIMGHNMPLIIKTDNKQLFLLAPYTDGLYCENAAGLPVTDILEEDAGDGVSDIEDEAADNVAGAGVAGVELVISSGSGVNVTGVMGNGCGVDVTDGVVVIETVEPGGESGEPADLDLVG